MAGAGVGVGATGGESGRLSTILSTETAGPAAGHALSCSLLRRSRGTKVLHNSQMRGSCRSLRSLAGNAGARFDPRCAHKKSRQMGCFSYGGVRFVQAALSPFATPLSAERLIEAEAAGTVDCHSS